MGFWSSVTRVFEDAADTVSDVANDAADATISTASGIATTAADGITTYSLAAASGVTSATGAAIDWSLTSVGEVKDFAVNAPGAVADFSETAFDASLDALKDGWQFILELAAHTMPRLDAPSSAAEQFAMTLFPGFAHLFEEIAAASRMTCVFRVKSHGLKAGLYVDRDGQWGTTDGFVVTPTFPTTDATFETFLAFRSRSGASGAKYFPIGLEYTGSNIGVNAMLGSDLRFLGFKFEVTVEKLRKMVGGKKSQERFKLKPNNPVNVKDDLEASVKTMVASSGTLDAVAEVAARAHAAGTSVSDPAIEQAARAVRATGQAAREVETQFIGRHHLNGAVQFTAGIPYRDGHGNPVVAQKSGGEFLIAPGGDFNRHTRDRCLSTQDFDGAKRCLTLNVNGDLVLAPGARATNFTYKDNAGGMRVARMNAPYFIHALGGDFTTSHPDNHIDYRTAGGTRWIAVVNDDGTFYHYPPNHFAGGHLSANIVFLDHAGIAQNVYLQRDSDGDLLFRFPNNELRSEIRYQVGGDGAHWVARLTNQRISADSANELRPYFVHAPDNDLNRSHTDFVIDYLTPNGDRWRARLDGHEFIHAPEGDFSRAHRDNRINYLCCGGQNWWARIEQDPATGRWLFHHSQSPDLSGGHLDTHMSYHTWDRGVWSAYPYFPGLSSTGPKPAHPFFIHQSHDASREPHIDQNMAYLVPGGGRWVARLMETRGFLHAPEGDFNRAHGDTRINYDNSGNSWWARIETFAGNQREGFFHSRAPDFTSGHHDSHMAYRTWDGSYWNAYPWFPRSDIV